MNYESSWFVLMLRNGRILGDIKVDRDTFVSGQNRKVQDDEVVPVEEVTSENAVVYEENCRYKSQEQSCLLRLEH